MKKIGIIGGGISGLVAAINLKKDNNEVTILEKNNECGKKILLTGNGRCNFYNEDMDINHFHSSSDQIDIINQNDMDIVLNFIDSLGIEKKIKNGYYYPFSNKASTIRDTLLYEVNKRKINVKTNYEVRDIKKVSDKYIVNNELDFDYLIISCGGSSYPKTGSTGDINNILSNMDVKINKLLPSLTNLHTDASFLKDWQGIREDVRVSIYVDDNLKKEEEGEIQLTKYGISGICVFNISRYASIGLSEGKKVKVKIDFLPSIGDIKAFLDNKQRDLELLELLKRIFNETLAKIIIDESNIKRNVIYKNLSDIEKTRLFKSIKEFTLDITKTGSFDESQVTIGGVPLDEINNNMELKKHKGLFVIGEALDIDGDCGGYNIAFAIYSALKVGIND